VLLCYSVAAARYYQGKVALCLLSCAPVDARVESSCCGSAAAAVAAAVNAAAEAAAAVGDAAAVALDKVVLLRAQKALHDVTPFQRAGPILPCACTQECGSIAHPCH
jgi:hypothetical protein